ncbi:MAG: hypothetical protein E6G44_07915 [Actinobacteria bacterium]|nr:MAG: hypothetical protein E6G44_07915 [Actinomycetota bacterium]
MEERQEVKASPRDRPRWVAVGALVFGAGLVIGIAVASLTAAGAQTGSSSPSPDAEGSVPGSLRKGYGHGRFGHEGFGPELGFRLRFGAIHGEFTIRGPNGAYQTLATQLGTVTSVSASSIAVKSEDGFSRTYAVNDNTLVDAGNNGIADVKSGDTVRVVATVSGGKATAVEVIDATNVRRLRGRWLPGFPGPPEMGSPSPGA